MKFKERLLNAMSLMKKQSDDSLKLWKFGLIGLIVADLIGLWWYLKVRTLAIGVFIVLLAFLCWILYEESYRKPASEETSNKPDKPDKPTPEKKIDKPNKGLDLGFQMPSSEDLVGDMDMGINTSNLNKDMGLPTISDSKSYNRKLNSQFKSI